MLLSHSEALECFRSLPENLQFPGIHPEFVRSDAGREPGLQPRFFCYRNQGDCYLHAFHLGEAAPLGGRWKDVQSPYGYGGPVSTTLEPAFLKEAWAAWVGWCRNQKVLAEFLRFHPLINTARFFEGDVIPNRKTVWIDLSGEDFSAGYSQLTRRWVRKAAAQGCTVEAVTPEVFHDAFLPLYRELMTEKQASSYYHFPEDQLQHLAAQELSLRMLCRRDGVVISAALFLQAGSVMEYHLGSSTETGRTIGAARLLMHEAALESRRRGCRVLHLGGGTDGSDSNPLLFYKQGFSRQLGDYQIGRRIHHAREYEELKRDWLTRYPGREAWVLFYRHG